METASLIISILAIFFAGYTYFKHDRKLKVQSRLLNEYQIAKIIKETEDTKKAIIEANVIKGDKGRRTINIFNRGKAKASNVNVKFLGAENVFISNEIFPIEIRPQSGVDINAGVSMDSPMLITLEFHWDDEFKTGNTYKQAIQIV